MLQKKKWIAVALAGYLGVMTSLKAQDIRNEHFFYRDFLDLGQNKGVFSAGAQNVILHSSKTPGVSVDFQSPIIDQSARSNNGNSTALGRNFAITATHVKTITQDTANGVEQLKWGNSYYGKPQESGNYGLDVRFLRYNKYIVEGETEIWDSSLSDSTSKPLTDEEKRKRLEELKTSLESYKNSEGKYDIFQAGQGRLSLKGGAGIGFANGGIGGATGLRGGSFGAISFDQIVYTDSKVTNAWGLKAAERTDSTWYNGITPGDSGSAFYIYNQKEKKWQVFGVTSSADLIGAGYAGVAIATKKDFEKYKKSVEEEVDLQGKTNWTLSQNALNTAGSETLTANKDIIFKNGGDIQVQSNIYRNTSGSIGGFVFKAKSDATAEKPTIYRFTTNGGTQSNGKIYGFDGAGLDIEENVKVEWGLGFTLDKNSVNDALHKVGKGTLEIKTGDNAVQGYLRVGDGKVIFNTEHQVFKGVYLTSGRGTLELTKGKAQAFGAIKDTTPIDTKFPNSFELEQKDTSSLGIYFGNGGGNLDLKGNTLTLNTISSNDAFANIINTETGDTNKSNIVIEGYGYGTDKNKTQEKADTIIHASFGQSTDSKKDNSSSNNNINLIYKGDDKPLTDENKAALIFDGNVNVKGLQVDDGKVVLQGHPTTHAYIRNNISVVLPDGKSYNLLDLVKRAEGQDLPEWMDLSRPSHLEQPDWDHRVFKIGKVDLKNSNLDIGREATLEADIKADDKSTINFGGDIKHYIDRKDGENTTGNGFEYQQQVESQKLKEETQKIANQTIHFKGSIEADGTKINSSIYDFNAKIDLKNNASLNADFLTLDRETHKSGAILTMDQNSTAEVKNLIFKGLTESNKNDVIQGSGNGGTNGKLSVTESLGFEKSTFDLSSLDSMGFTKPQNYDIFVKDKSQITGNNTMITGNVGVMNESTLTLKSITLKDTKNGTTTTKDIQESSLKNSILVEGKNSKLEVNEKITSQNQDNTLIIVNGFKETTGGGTRDVVQGERQEVIHEATLKTTQGIELNGTKAYGLDTTCGDKSGVDCFADESMNGKISNIVLTTGGKIESDLKATNLQLNVNVDKDSSFLGSGKKLEADKSSVALNFELGGKEQEFNIDAKQKSHITLTAHAKESLVKDEKAFGEALQASQYKGAITADNQSKIDSNLSNITASVDLKGGASLNIAEGGILTLKDNFNSIKLDGENTALNANTIIADNLSSITFDIKDTAKFNVTNFVFKNGSVEAQKFYGENVWLQDSAQVTLKGTDGIKHNLYIADNSTFKTDSNNALKIDKGGDTKIQTEIGSKLEIKKLEATSGSNVYIALDLEKVNENPLTKQVTQSTQKNFDIDAKGGSNVYVNSWDMNREGFGNNGNNTTSLTTDADSRIHFGILKHDMAKQNHITSPIQANLSISQSLTLEHVGKPTQNNKPISNMASNSANSRDITSENATNPTNQAYSESDPAKLAAQAGTNDDRFHALKLQGNTMGQDGVVQNDGKNLTLDNGTRIDVKLDESIKAPNGSGNGNGDFQLNKYYTLISAGSITDNRTDKRIYFEFAENNTPLYWVTIVEDGQVKVKFTKEDPSSYNELKNYINDDKLLEIVIQHNPKNDFVQMAGMANQHQELNSYLAGVNQNMNNMATNNGSAMSNKVLYANNEAINTRVMQVKVMQPTFSKYKLVMNTAQNTQANAEVASDTEPSAFDEIRMIIESIEEQRKKNNAWVNVGGGYFGQSGGNLVFYGTNLGYDRLFSFGSNDYLIGAMAGIGGSNYSLSGIKDTSLFYNVGFYVNTDIQEVHEVQSNMNFSYMDSNKTIESQNNMPSDSMRAGTFGWLWSSYYKYKFDFGNLGEFKQVLKPVGLINIGFNGIGAFSGTTYKQKAYNDFNFALGAGVEYSIVKENAIYSAQVIAKQGVYSSGDQIFVSLSNAQNFMGYDLRNNTLGFQLNFTGYNKFDYDLSLQYGISSLFDIQGNFGVKGDVRLQYKF
ncbi:MAG: S6 family peptidase [Helicobacter sp.]|uniref:S6 family peptidase n=1 Tax=Helicobacter sp. TaxID=218 RepID=UPI002A911E63|nr:S6 family peptidase [Helicobacter sp.]MDY5950434.1 S6 family peptidase [Helicobacter sp.]